MKKILLLFACVAALQASAQKKLTEKELLGKWNLTAIKMPMGTIDLKNEVFTPNEEAVKELDVSDEEINEMGIALVEEMGYSNEHYVLFTKGGHFESNMDDGWVFDFQLVEDNGKNYIVDEEMKFEVYINNRQLYFVLPGYDGEGDTLMIFEK